MAYDQESREAETDRRETAGVGASPGKTNRTQRLGANAAAGEQTANHERGAASYAFYPEWEGAGGGAHDSQPTADDPFALHLASGERGEKGAPIVAGAPDRAAAPSDNAPATAAQTTAAGDAEASPASNHQAAADGPVADTDAPSAAAANAATDTDGSGEASPADAPHAQEGGAHRDTPALSAEVPVGDHPATDVVGANASQIQAQAQSEYQQAISAIGQRESMLRGSFAQQRAAIGTVAATQAALARADAKAATDRIRGRNGIASRTIGEMVDGEVARMRQGTQDAMTRVSAADKKVRPAVQQAAANAATNANLELRDANEGQLLNELRDRMMPKAVTAAMNEHRDAHARGIDALASTRDRNVREMRRAGQMLASQVDNQLRDVEKALLGSGESLAAIIHRNAQSQLKAIDAAEKDAAAFFARARIDAQRILTGGVQAASSVRAQAAHVTGPGDAAKLATAAANVSPQLAAQRARLIDKVDGVVARASSILGKGVTEFGAECTGYRAMAHGDHASIEAKLAGEVAGKVAHVKAEWSKDTDVFIISANSFAAAVEFSRSHLIANLPAQFGGILRSAVLEARKSRLEKIGEGVWGVISGLVTTIAKFVAVTLAILVGPIAFGIAALIGKAGALAGLFRDAAMAVVGMVEAFKERFKILFRSWDGWPWYGKVAGIWATTLLAMGDIIGLPSIFESASGRELMSNRDLTDQERGSKVAGGGIAALTTLIPAKLHADTLARNATARTMGAELAETEALAHAQRQLPEGAGSAPAVAGEATGATAEQVILQRADLEIAEAAQRVKPMPDTLDVFVHGEVDNFIVFDEGMVPRQLSHRSLAKYIEKSGKSYKRIRLIACKSGMHPQGAAQHLANKLNAKLIEAPTDKVHIHGDGSMTIGPSDTVNTGHWEPFKPKPSSYRYTEYRAPKVTETRYERFLRERAEKAAAQAEGVGTPHEMSAESPAASSSMHVAEGEAKTMGRRPRPRDSADSLFDEREPGSTVHDDAADMRHGDDPADHVPDSDDAGDLGLSRDGDRRVRHVAKSQAPSSVAQEAGAGVLSSNRLGITRPPRHHVLPQAEIEFFQERGFPGRAIDDFTIEMPTPLHEEVHGLNQSMARRYWPEKEWNTEVMSRLREAEALKKMQLRRQLRAQKAPAADINTILETSGKLTPDEIWNVVNQVMVKFKIDGMPFVKYDAPASVRAEAPNPGNQP